MICTVYWAPAGFILVPDCMTASREAERVHGPPRPCGHFDTQGLQPELAQQIDREMDHRSFAPLPADLAMRLGYAAVNPVPLPPDFAWQQPDWWESEGELILLCGATAVACIRPAEHAPAWLLVTHYHKSLPFRGTRVSSTRAAAIQFAALWAQQNADALRHDVASAQR